MTITRFLTLSLVAGSLVSCADYEPTAPLSRAAESPVARNGAEQGWQRVTFSNDRTFFIPCLNEDVRIYGYLIYWYHEMPAPLGGFDIEIPKAPILVAVGRTSGRVFAHQTSGPRKQAFHLAAEGVQNVVVNEEYSAPDGTTLSGDAIFRFTVNANGDLTIVDRVEYALTCK